MRFLPFVLLIILFSCKPKEPVTESKTTIIHYPSEIHLKNIKQWTFGGDNAEAYWSFDNKVLTFQSNFSKWGVECDQIFFASVNNPLKDKIPKMISTGNGRTTCAYFMPGNKSILYASTHLHDTLCPGEPERRTDGKYVWPIYEGYDIYVADLTGKMMKQLTSEPGYDAEATVSPRGDKIVFTSIRSGDLELYTMDIDGGNVKQITNELGYDGGAFFSPDGNKLVFRASRPKTEEEQRTYKELLAEGMVMPTSMEIFVCNVDGSNLKQITKLGKANWAPFFHPKGDRIIFSSNHKAERAYPFNLYMINTDGTGLKQITFDDTFDAFPVFSPDGKKLVFSSNRNNGGSRATNIFIADWVENP